MRIFAKTGKPARIELTSYEKRVLGMSGDICASVANNSSGDLKESATNAAIYLKNVLQHLGDVPAEAE